MWVECRSCERCSCSSCRRADIVHSVLPPRHRWHSAHVQVLLPVCSSASYMLGTMFQAGGYPGCTIGACAASLRARLSCCDCFEVCCNCADCLLRVRRGCCHCCCCRCRCRHRGCGVCLFSTTHVCDIAGIRVCTCDCPTELLPH
jgi:hypothetical protein